MVTSTHCSSDSAHSTVVIKIGSNALLDDRGHLDEGLLRGVSAQMASLCDDAAPILVSSGAVATGRAFASAGPKPIVQRHALAAIGQAQLASAWQDAMMSASLQAAQILVTEGDFSDAERFASLEHTLSQLLGAGIVPIVNENDAVPGVQKAIGDNDWLAAELAVRMGAERVLFLTDIDGVYDADPRFEPAARRVPLVTDNGRSLIDAAGGPDEHGTGGMRSKLLAASLASSNGVHATIAPARAPRVIERCVAEEDIGTRVLAEQSDLDDEIHGRESRARHLRTLS